MEVTGTKQVDLSTLSVHFGMPVNHDLPPKTVTSLVSSLCLLAKRGMKVECQMEIANCYVERSRCLVADNFLRGECDRLLWLDADMVWEPQDVVRLLALSTFMDVVAAPYVIKKDGINEFIVSMPEELTINEWGCVAVNGLGLGFCVVTRKVMEALAKVAPLTSFTERPHLVSAIFQNRIVSGVFQGEDMGFFEDCKRLGFQPWVDPSINLGHVGAKEYRGDFMQALSDWKSEKESKNGRAKPEPDQWGNAPTATGLDDHLGGRVAAGKVAV